ncbi:SAM-dependent methyltransferase [Bacillus halotolerans]|uniref:class I SAM-dependent DNA methyltransferase n=1 Tax=Bacillus halotolerans TaxID=260554 RepID=UPI000D01AFAE|nr:class I SAM-dependent methyltransferase [Bacillus halotolerans]MBL6008111.1 methyltransferase domain-containing protein [Bacillus halotolerans]PRP52810.1 SAM-dependent methyltransferase [Bacillus halotolerans]PRP60313.1 SAM-dependent methyltransferase [Bacillus halotolerans]PRP64978.1 SAM-dependent methyltransferase [Bacillus halotolerans]
MIYQGFASVYDELMSHAPYDKWTKWIETSLPEKGRILDLACGTGEISIRLAEKGFEVTGIDLSEEMLSYAQQKGPAKQPILFLQQDMREITGFEGQFDAVVICCDSLNYLKTKNDVMNTFKSVFQVLKPDGILLFDVHSPYKITEVFPGSTFADQDEDISYIWQSFAGSEELSAIHDMSFFVWNGEAYDRFDETHEQRTFRVDEYEEMLASCGFQLHKVTADFTDSAPSPQSERLFFKAQKSKTIVY